MFNIIRNIKNIMTRISGVNLPLSKKIFISLTYIYGIGISRSINILHQARIPLNLRTNKLTEKNIVELIKIVDHKYIVENELHEKVAIDVKSLVDVNSYRGKRHTRCLPVRGQRTHTNARTNRRKKLKK